MNASVRAVGPPASMGGTSAGAQFLLECQNFIAKNSGRQPNEPSTVQDISSLVHLMKCMFTCFAPALEAAQKLPQLMAEINQTRAEVNLLREKFAVLAGNYNDMLRYSYDQNALVHGVQEDDNETPESLRKAVLQVLSVVQTRPKANDLENVHRLGVRKAGKIRPIVCRFVNRSIKRRVVGEFYRKRKSEQAAAGSAEAARLIRSPVTNHVPFKRLLDVDCMFSADDPKADKEPAHTHMRAAPHTKKKKTFPRRL